MSTSLLDSVSKELLDAPGFRALALMRLDGRIEDLKVVDPSLDSEVLTEFATLLRIAHSTSEDASDGGLSEMSWRSSRSLVLMNRVTPERFLVFFGAKETATGRVRYLLRQDARRLSVRIGSPATPRRTV